MWSQLISMGMSGLLLQLVSQPVNSFLNMHQLNNSQAHLEFHSSGGQLMIPVLSSIRLLAQKMPLVLRTFQKQVHQHFYLKKSI